jgi:pimeloyl-ACP methyl ester carboxylesterase
MARSAGADIYFERRGDGPPLLLIVGGGGDCGYYTGLATLLAGEYTVLTYDRRGNSRSPLHGAPVRIDLAGQSTDAIAVLNENGFSSASVFGNSGGATIALDLAAHHPEAVDSVVSHEPPVPAVLPGAGAYLAIYDDIDRALETGGWREAFTTFQVRVGGATPEIMTVLLEPAKAIPPGPALDFMERVSRNWEYMTKYEIRSFIDYRPDLDRIAANRVPVALARGAATPDPVAVRMSEVTAERLGAECAEFPGGHTAPVDMPGQFAPRLRNLLRRLQGPAGDS